MGKAITSLRCHALVLLALVLDFGVAALVALTYKKDILLPFAKNNIERTLQNYLPTFGTILGAGVAYANKSAISALVTIQARRRMASRGLTFKQISYYDVLSQGGIPMTLKAIFFLAVTLLVTVMLLSTAIVNSITATAMEWGVANQMPAVSFSSQSGVVPPIYCELGGGNVNKYGYGTNCPLDNVYGEMYNAFTTSLRGTFPVNSTENGVSYPSNFIGISGSIATLTKRFGDAITKNNNRDILPTDALDTCVPRLIVTASCSPNLPSGTSFQTQTLTVSGNGPQNIQQVSLCHSNGNCVGPRWGPNYGNGMISVFRESDLGSGDTTVTLFSVGKYAQNLTSPGISCVISAQEEFIPIRITGGLSVSSLPSFSCQNYSSPNPVFMTNLTRLGGMGLEKMQGQDGKLEAISHIPDGQDRIEAIELGLERMISVAATDMYSTIDALSGSNATWSNHQAYFLQTQRFRLGVKGRYSVIFVLPPAILILILLAGWFAVGFSRMGDLGFNPLDPPSAIVAGMNRERLPVEVANLSDASQDELHNSNLLLKYGNVSGGRMGVEVNGSSYVPVGHGSRDSAVGYKDESPMTSPFPSPAIQGLRTQYY